MQSPEDLQRLQESLLVFKRDFSRANSLQDSTIKLMSIKALSKVEVCLIFKLEGKAVPKGFCLKFQAIYTEDNFQSFVNQLIEHIRNYTSKLDSVVQIVKFSAPEEITWNFYSDEDDIYLFVCQYQTNISHGHYSIQFGQHDILDIIYLSDKCKSCVANCMKLYNGEIPT